MAINIRFAGAQLYPPGGSGNFYVSWSKYRVNEVWECPSNFDMTPVVKFYRTFYKLTGACDLVNYRYQQVAGETTMKIYVVLGYNRAPDREQEGDDVR